MYSLLKALGVELMLRREALPFAASFCLAALLYRFGSFAVECVAFLVTWYVASALQARLMRLGRPEPDKPTPRR